ncbi:MAG: hypothetical protein ACT4PN_08710 [Nitrospiraceae bacterium]
MSSKTSIKYFCVLAMLPIFVFLSGCNLQNADEKEFYRQIDRTPLSKEIPFSDFEALHKYTNICVVQPYAIRASAQEESLARIFNKINYANRKTEIYNAANDDSAWSIYLVKNESIESRLIIKSKTLKRDSALKSGCYAPSNVCVEKVPQSENIFLKLSICD